MNPRPPACKAGALTAELTSPSRGRMQIVRAQSGCQAATRSRPGWAGGHVPQRFQLLPQLLRHLLWPAAAPQAGEALADQRTSSATRAGWAGGEVGASPGVAASGRRARCGRWGSGRAARPGCRPARPRPGCRPASSPPGRTVWSARRAVLREGRLARARLRPGRLEVGDQRLAVLLPGRAAGRAGRGASAGRRSARRSAAPVAPAGSARRRDPQRHVQGRLVDRAGSGRGSRCARRALRRGRR